MVKLFGPNFVFTFKTLSSKWAKKLVRLTISVELVSTAVWFLVCSGFSWNVPSNGIFCSPRTITPDLFSIISWTLMAIFLLNLDYLTLNVSIGKKIDH